MTASAPSFRLDGRRALVVGASRGIGRAVAEAMAASGADVTLCARTADEIEAIADALRHQGFRAEALVTDVTDTQHFAETVAALPAFDILVNNAGTNRPLPLAQTCEEDYDAVMALNLRAAVFATKAVTARMLAESRPGTVINMSSQMGHVGAANRTIYCASKWALEGFTKALAVELAPAGIRVNTICPTFVETPMTKPFLENPDFRDEVLAKIPLGRLGKVDEIAAAAVYLASDAAGLMTGSALKLDGGWTAL
ncbi:SDR family NAD(P)-dependent oxidoreductase [Martelella radicis]|uniref:NAD(P)-dependent dehydrogenase (Short-subunit alcohol dehydrogenase family) n=1 Tax=Martelella radicis TaxID=1397476 RepID=A0A7W6PBE8_9HYPH|nr:glucose 1-dehydrogenase [Martelella radicis]MBB4122574.1 NAD(P)-dependent dehydrogenase (short-subunit alcohol dehydrogenase family) [Martelella radicis]